MTDLTALTAATGVYGLWGHAAGATVVWGGAVVIAQTAAVLAAARAWEPIVLGQGSVEFTRLLRAFVGSAVLVALVGLAVQLPETRPWVFGVLPLAGLFAAAAV